MDLRLSAALVMVIVTNGCGTLTQPADKPMPVEAGRISISVGPCFGFCPVYEMGVDASGLVTFQGDRHTAILGAKAAQHSPALYLETAKALTGYKPAVGETATTICDQRISDQQHFTIIWSSNNGRSSTLLHDKGCRSIENDRLNAVLEALPSRLGIENWAKQTTRPGSSRG